MAHTLTVPLIFRDSMVVPATFKRIDVTVQPSLLEGPEEVIVRLEHAIQEWAQPRHEEGWTFYMKNGNKISFRDIEVAFSKHKESMAGPMATHGISQLKFTETTVTQGEIQDLGGNLFDLDRVILPLKEA